MALVEEIGLLRDSGMNAAKDFSVGGSAETSAVTGFSAADSGSCAAGALSAAKGETRGTPRGARGYQPPGT